MLSEIFKNPKPIIGVIQLLPLPGSAKWDGKMDAVILRAEQEATALASAGVDGILIENYFDSPYAKTQIDSAAAIAMAQIAHRIQHFTDTPLGISVLENDPTTALAIAMNIGARFIRVPVLVGTLISEEGMVQGKINQLCAYRKELKNADNIKIFANVTMNQIVPTPQRQAPWKAPLAYLEQIILSIKKHNVADALILSNLEIQPQDIDELKKTANLPILVGDALTPEEAQAFYIKADGLLLAHGIKKNAFPGINGPPSIDMTKVEELIAKSRQSTVTAS